MFLALSAFSLLLVFLWCEEYLVQMLLVSMSLGAQGFWGKNM